MKLNDAFDSDGGWTLSVVNQPDGTAVFEISIKEAPRRWRRESITLSKQDIVKLARYLDVKID
ncbi:MAG: hypothetical protein J2P48_08390 [Alphaproteobacteria bacterium]|nr:hypothetical protein [Alphaproteobacteria bacterium]